jgi:VRR-NUC domain.
MQKLIPLESEEQQALFEWANLMSKKAPELNLLVAIPNGGLRNKAVAVRLRAEGTRKGFPDMILPVARGDYHSLAVELKRTKGGRIAPEQQRWLNDLSAQGWKAVVCYGFDDAKKIIEEYLKLAPNLEK